MKSLGFRGMVLLVLAFAFAVPAFAAQPGEVSGTIVPDSTTGKGKFTGTFEGELEHIFSEGRADKGYFKGYVDDRYGEVVMLLVRQWASDPWAPGLKGKWVILHGSGDLENLRGQGTFVVVGDLPDWEVKVKGSYHFDPDESP